MDVLKTTITCTLVLISNIYNMHSWDNICVGFVES